MRERILLIVCVLEALIIGYLLYRPSSVVVSDVPVKEIVRDSIIRDSIFIINDSIRTEIKYVKEQHKQDSLDIMSANDNVLFDSFSRYIEDYNNK